MFRPGLRRRHTLAAGLAAAIGFVMGAVSSSPTGIVLAVAMTLLAVLLIARNSSQRAIESLHELQWFVAGWRDSLDGSSPTLDVTDEISSLRDEMEATRKYLFAQRLSLQEQGASLRRDTALLQTVLGAMVEGVVVLDDRSQLLYVNPAARRLLDFGQRDISGRLLHELSRSARLLDVVRRVQHSRTEQNVEFAMTREHRTLAVAASPLPFDTTESRGTGVVLVLYDVTDLRKLEQMRRDFVSNVSHELKTPLTSIQAYADSLLDGALEDPDINRLFIERIIEQAERLRKLILDLIGLARVESQQDSPELKAMDIRETVRQCVDSHTAVAAARQVTLTMNEAPDPLVIAGNPESLTTILDNLIRNAVNYTPEGGRVTVHARRRGTEVELEVEDTGIGITKEMQPRVFERFFRVDKARSRDAGGTGLGLSIVKHLTLHLNGRIELDSEPDHGSRFRVLFPSAPDNR